MNASSPVGGTSATRLVPCARCCPKPKISTRRGTSSVPPPMPKSPLQIPATSAAARIPHSLACPALFVAPASRRLFSEEIESPLVIPLFHRCHPESPRFVWGEGSAFRLLLHLCLSVFICGSKVSRPLSPCRQPRLAPQQRCRNHQEESEERLQQT